MNLSRQLHSTGRWGEAGPITALLIRGPSYGVKFLVINTVIVVNDYVYGALLDAGTVLSASPY